MTQDQAIKVLVKTAKTRLKRLAIQHNLYKHFGVLGAKGEHDEYERITQAIQVIQEAKNGGRQGNNS